MKVFVSYSWSNSAERRALEGEISHIKGVTLLVDRNEIAPGGSVHGTILTMIDSADCAVVFLTPEGLASKEVLDEISRFHDRGKLIIPVVSDSIGLDAMPWFLRDILFIRYDGRNFDSVVEKVCDTIRRYADPLSEIDLAALPASVRKALDGGARFLEVPSPRSKAETRVVLILKMRQSDAQFVVRIPVQSVIEDVASHLANELLPHLKAQDYEWELARKEEPLPEYLTIEAAGLKSGDSVYLLGNHRRPRWAPSQ